MSSGVIGQLRDALRNPQVEGNPGRQLPVLLAGPADAGKLWALEEAARDVTDSSLLVGDCRVADRLAFPAEPLLRMVELGLRRDELLDFLEESGCQRLQALLHGRADIEAVFSRSRSFFGFKHRREEILQPLDTAREIALVLQRLSRNRLLILALRHMEDADALLVRILELLPVFCPLFCVRMVFLYDDTCVRGEVAEWIQRLRRDGAPLLQVGAGLWEERVPPGSSTAQREKLQLTRLTPGERLVWLRWGRDDSPLPEHGLELAEALLAALSPGGRQWLRLFAFWQEEISIAALDRMSRILEIPPADVAAARELGEKSGLIVCRGERLIPSCESLLRWIRELTEADERIRTAAVLRENRPCRGMVLEDQLLEFRLAVAAAAHPIAFRQAFALARAALCLHSASHSLDFLHYASEYLRPRLSRPDPWELFEFHRFFGNVLVLDHQTDRARRQFEVAMELIDSLRDAEADTLRARLCNDLAFLELSTPAGDCRRARRHLSRSLRFASTARNRVSTSNQFALAHYLDGDLEMAKVFFSDNLKMLMMRKGEEEFRDELDSTLRGLAAIAQRSGELRRALGCINELIELHEGREEWDVMAHTWQYRGMVLARRGDFKEALADFQRSLELCERAVDLFGRARVLINLGQTQLLLGMTASAGETLRESLKLSREMGNVKGEAISLGQLAQIMVLQGNFHEAHAMLGTDRSIAERINDQYGVAWTLVLKAEAYFWEGKISHARGLFADAHLLAARRNFLAPMVQAGLGQVRCLLAGGSMEQAIAELEGLEIQMAHREDPVLEGRLQMVRAEVELVRHRLFKAAQRINQAFVIFKRLGLRFDLALCRLREARIARLQGETETGQHRLEEAVDLFRAMEATYFVNEASRLLEFPPAG